MTSQTAVVSLHDVTTLPTAEHQRLYRLDRLVHRLEVSLLAVVPATGAAAATGIIIGNGILTGSVLATGATIAIGTVVARYAVDTAARAAKPAGAAVVADRPDYTLTPGDVARRVEAV